MTAVLSLNKTLLTAESPDEHYTRLNILSGHIFHTNGQICNIEKSHSEDNPTAVLYLK